MHLLDRPIVLFIFSFSLLFAVGSFLPQSTPLLYAFLTLIIIILILVRFIFVMKKKQKRLEMRQLKNYNDTIILGQEEAAEAQRVKDTFLANISHETRTPMNAIIGLSHILLQSDLNAVQQANVSKIKRSAEHFLAISNDILDFSKIKAGKLHINHTNFELQHLLNDLADITVIQAVKKKLDLIFDVANDVPDSFIGDSLRINQVLINLINNAIKFTDTGKIILHISLISQHEHDYEILFEVEDTGIGLTEEQLPKIFESFDQADNSISRKYGGTGLGLAISKELLEMMDSTLKVKSSYRMGSTFYFTIPLKTDSHYLQEKNKHIERIMLNKTVLIFDKDLYTAEILSNILLHYKALPKTVSSLDELYSSLQKVKYDALFIDAQYIPDIKDNALLYKKCNAIVLLKYDLNSELSDQQLEVNSTITKPFTHQSVLLSMTDIFGKNIAVSTIKKTTATIKDILVLKGSKILLAEDNEGNRMVIEGLLEGSGIKLITVTNGQKAVEAVFNHPDKFELILMDINMPVMDGYVATSIIREYQKYDNIPIIAMTANITESDVKKSKRYGMQAHIHKPIDIAYFYKTLLQYIPPKITQKKVVSEAKQAEKASKEETTLNALIALPFIDSEDGLARLNGNVRAYQNILYKFADLFENIISEFTALANDSSFSKGHALAHNLKGLAGNIGAKEIYNLAKELEEAFKEAHGEIYPLIDAIQAKLAPLIQGISSLEKTETSQTTKNRPAITTKEMRTLLSALYQHAKQKKALHVKKSCLKIEEYTWPIEQQKTIEQILQAAQVYKFDNVQKHILTLIPDI